MGDLMWRSLLLLLLVAPGCRRQEPAPLKETAPASPGSPSATPSASAGAMARPDVTRAAPAPKPVAEGSPTGVLRSQVVPAEPGQTVVVWVRSPPNKGQLAGDDVSHFLKPDGTVAASRPGVYIARGKELFRHVTAVKKLSSWPCPPEQQGILMTGQTLREAALERVRDGRREALVPFDLSHTPDGEADSETPAVEQELVPVALAGSTYFVVEKTDWYECGALHQHYMRKTRAFRIDEDGASLELDLTPLESLARQSVDRAVALFNKGASREKDSPDGPRAADDLSVWSQFPAFSPQGVRWQIQFAGSASWAGSDFQTGEYMRSVLVSLDTIPAALGDAARLPGPARAYLAAHPKEQVLGVSVGAVAAP